MISRKGICTAFDLGDYLTDPDHSPSEITWLVSGHDELNISIDPDSHPVLDKN